MPNVCLIFLSTFKIFFLCAGGQFGVGPFALCLRANCVPCAFTNDARAGAHLLRPLHLLLRLLVPRVPRSLLQQHDAHVRGGQSPGEQLVEQMHDARLLQHSRDRRHLRVVAPARKLQLQAPLGTLNLRSGVGN